jgi:hypothetical protein
MYDDHFFAIEPAYAVMSGFDCDNSLPHSGKPLVIAHSFLYPELNSLIFYFCHILKMANPQSLMLVIRIVHAFFSMLTVYFGLRITKKLAGLEAAKISGMLLALYWFMPILSVHNLFEMACLPFIVVASWFIVRKSTASGGDAILAALFMGIAFSFRYQTLVFAVGIGIALLLLKNWRAALLFGFGYFIFAIGIDAISEYIIGEKPLKELVNYYQYNILHRYDYIKLPWFMYLLTIGGLLIPPISLFLLFGFLKSWKKNLLLSLPTIILLVFHSSFPNKQERFILPVIPFLIILGLAGWREFYLQSGFWKRNMRLYSGLLTWFWGINLILLMITVFTYTKRSNTESLSWLYNHGKDKRFIEEKSTGNDFLILPVFYLGRCDKYLTYVKSDNIENFRAAIKKMPSEERPGFILFFGREALNERVVNMQKVFPLLNRETVIESGLVDKVLQLLNPINKNEDCYIYSIKSYKE